MKNRLAIAALALVIACMSLAPAQAPLEATSPWANKLFGSSEAPVHDFGVVPRGTMLRHDFTVVNILATPIEVTNVRTAMAPVHSQLDKRTLQPGEKTTLTVQMDSSRFVGHKEVALYVAVGSENGAGEARLTVKALARENFVCSPGQVDFGAVRSGNSASVEFDVEHLGQKNWRLLDVSVPKNAPFEATAKAFERRVDITSYRVTVTLDKNAPRGPFLERIFVESNDPTAPIFPVDVRGNVTDKIGAKP